MKYFLSYLFIIIFNFRYWGIGIYTIVHEFGYEVFINEIIETHTKIKNPLALSKVLRFCTKSRKKSRPDR